MILRTPLHRTKKDYAITLELTAEDINPPSQRLMKYLMVHIPVEQTL